MLQNLCITVAVPSGCEFKSTLNNRTGLKSFIDGAADYCKKTDMNLFKLDWIISLGTKECPFFSLSLSLIYVHICMSLGKLNHSW